ncbi:uncharacterized protein LOC128279161 [Anopheles cruzii]|uniref:uncharacterized protein LOC128279161 n=1 Tax=Anopheles cruzii TaxID=68878 RepID=UPI0022EC6612|nr:uncharacterized protein LOC128279161 [Anopheles cruzii]
MKNDVEDGGGGFCFLRLSTEAAAVTGRKLGPDVKQPAEKKTDVKIKIKDDPGGGAAKPSMELSDFHNERNSTSSVSQPAHYSAVGPVNGGSSSIVNSTGEQRKAATGGEPVTSAISGPSTTTTIAQNASVAAVVAAAAASNVIASNCAPSNHKYLHKKFKRIASVTPTEEEDDERERKGKSSAQEASAVATAAGGRLLALGNGLIESSTSSTANTAAWVAQHSHTPPGTATDPYGAVGPSYPAVLHQQPVVVVRPSATVAPLINLASSTVAPTQLNAQHLRIIADDDECAKTGIVRKSTTTISSSSSSSRRQLANGSFDVPGVNEQSHYSTLLHPVEAVIGYSQQSYHPQSLLLQQQPVSRLQKQTSTTNNSTSSVTTTGGGGQPLSALSLSVADSCDLGAGAPIVATVGGDHPSRFARSPQPRTTPVQFIVGYQHHQQQQQPAEYQLHHQQPVPLLLHQPHAAAAGLMYAGSGAGGSAYVGDNEATIQRHHHDRHSRRHHSASVGVTRSSSPSAGSSGSPSPPAVASAIAAAAVAATVGLPNSTTLLAASGAAIGQHFNSAVASAIAPGAASGSSTGRYVCPYCQMNCSKPSVLEKHIRRHTNERPFKCVLCGIAFKTKSNLYKHRRSRAHASKSQGEDSSGHPLLLDEDGASIGGSDIDDKELSNSGSEIMNYRGSPMEDRVHSPQQLLVEKPYKPKFHNAALYSNKFDCKPVATVGPVGANVNVVYSSAPQSSVTSSSNSGVGSFGSITQAGGVGPAHAIVGPHYLNGQNAESLEQHISKLIMQNEAIVDVVEAPLQKKYHKITGISRGISVTGVAPPLGGGGCGGSSVSATGSCNPMQGGQMVAAHDSTSTRLLANALLHKRQAEEQLLLQHQQHHLLQQMQQQEQQQQQHYFHYLHHPGQQQQQQQNVINLASKAIVAPKTSATVRQQAQQQQQRQPLLQVVSSSLTSVGDNAENGPLLSNGPEGASSSAAGTRPGSRGSTIVDADEPSTGGIQPLNLTKTTTNTADYSLSQASVLLQPAASATVNSASVDGEPSHALKPYRKRVLEPTSAVSVVSAVVAPTVTMTFVATSSSSSMVSVSSSSAAAASTAAVDMAQPPPHHVPLHVQISTAPSGPIVPPLRPTPTSTPPMTVANHPQNPERSIIKDLLLNSRGFGVVQNPDGENGENLYTCKMCNVSFRDVDSLKYHMICHCQGSGSNLNSPSSSSAPISPVGSPSAAAAYIRSRSVSSLKHLARSSLNPPATAGRQPSSLCKLAKSQLTRPRPKPENISIAPAALGGSSPAPLHGGDSDGAGTSSRSASTSFELIQNPLPSPGPLLGNTRLVDPQRGNDGKSQKHAPLAVDGGAMGRREPEKGADVLVEIDHEESHERAAMFRQALQSAATHFHFPPINQITAYNPLTLPKGQAARQETADPSLGQASQIVHGGKLIPFVQGMPGPNTLTAVAVPGGMDALQSVRTAPGVSTTVVNLQSLLTIVVPAGSCSTASSGPTLVTSSLPYKVHPSATDNSSSLLAIQQISRLGPDPAAVEKHLNKFSAAGAAVPPTNQPKNGFCREIWSPAKQQTQAAPDVLFKKRFNFTRIADNISPRKKETPKEVVRGTASGLVTEGTKKIEEVRYFNFETMISKSEILIKPPPPPSATGVTPTPSSAAQQHDSAPIGASPVPPPPPPDQSNLTLTLAASGSFPAPSKANKFLRPNTLPLKPGTFTPKRHHGITPTNNTMPLISPETPRPSKSCRELYFNGHAYTNIGLKSSTKPFYCTVNKTQPFYFQTTKQLSMYSNWQVHPENDPHPLGFGQVTVMALYDSNQQLDRRYSIACPKTAPLTVVASRGDVAISTGAHSLAGEANVRTTPVEVTSSVAGTPFALTTAIVVAQPQQQPSAGVDCATYGGGGHNTVTPPPCEGTLSASSETPMLNEPSMEASTIGSTSRQPSPRSESAEPPLSGGFESTEEYTYVRGRGRGKHVCPSCGIRCKKPSMLQKHKRTHTDVRPYSCHYCSFHFKTKGNLTKHMKSKSHYKKCTELGLNPVPVHVDDDGDQQSVSSERTSTIPGDSDTPTDMDADDTDDSEESKNRLPEHEAAQGLLSLSMTRPTSACSSLGGGGGGSGGPGSTMLSLGDATAGTAYVKPSPVAYMMPVEAVAGPLMEVHCGSSVTLEAIAAEATIRRDALPTNVVLSGASPATAAPAPRRVITFGSGPKLEYNLLKHEQYYSDPNVGRKKRDYERSLPNASEEAAQAGDADDEDETARPMDLTKKPRQLLAERRDGVEEVVAAAAGITASDDPRYDDGRRLSINYHPQTHKHPLAMVTPAQQSVELMSHHGPLQQNVHHLHEQQQQQQQQQQQRYAGAVQMSDVLTPITGTANLLTTLVSNTDKIPLMIPFEPTGGTTPSGVDGNAHFHEYLKQRALQDTKIKQSQMKPGCGSGILMMRDTTPPVQQQQQHHHHHQQHYPVQPNLLLQPAVVDPNHQKPPSHSPGTQGQPSAVMPLSTTTTVIGGGGVQATTERVYRIFNGKNDRHRTTPSAIAVTPSNNTLTSSAIVSTVGETTVGEPKTLLEVPLPGSMICSVIPGPPAVTVTSATVARVLGGAECPPLPENASPMDTLAEIAAGSLKLDVTKVPTTVSAGDKAVELSAPVLLPTHARSRSNSSTSGANNGAPVVPESAKTLASEYLKLTKSVTNAAGKRKREDSESGSTTSDQEGPIGVSAPSTVAAMLPVGNSGVSSEGRPIATVAPIVANANPHASQQQPGDGSAPASAGVASNPMGSVAAPSAAATDVAAAQTIGPVRKMVVGEDGFKASGGEFVAGTAPTFSHHMQEDGGRPVCEICHKKFHKLSQLSIHMNIHYMERKYRCEPCGTSFRSQGLYLKHERSATHRNKVSMTNTFGVATDTNPRPFYCRDCDVGFRIHGHLAKHLRSKLHILKLECLGKIPFGTYTKIEESGMNLNEIDTSDCENSLSSFQRLAIQLKVKDSSKMLPAGGSTIDGRPLSSGGACDNETDSCDETDNGGVGPSEVSSAGATAPPRKSGAEPSSEDSSQPESRRANPRTSVDSSSGGSSERRLGSRVEPGDGGPPLVQRSESDIEPRNINNNVKRKSDDTPAGVGGESSAASDAKRLRYANELDAKGSANLHAVE